MSEHSFQQLIQIPVNSVSLEGSLIIPKDSKALVIFVHGSGSSRHSPRNNYVAKVLREAGLATLLFDLLTEEEDIIYETRFDIPFLTKRLKIVTKWLTQQKNIKNLKMGYFGASTGAAAALVAAAELSLRIKAIVSRGGRPDLAMDHLSKVKSPTLLIVGGNDLDVLAMNKVALEKLTTMKKLEIVPNATHLFEEPGALEEVAHLAAKWFKQYLTSVK